MSYSHPNAEYIRVMQQEFKRRLWLERVIWSGVILVFLLPCLLGGVL